MIPFQLVLAGCGFGPLILAAFLGVGLDAEYKTVAIAWTRPISRVMLALRYVVVDGVTLLAAWVMTLVAAFVPIFALGLGRYLTYGQNGVTFLVLLFGAAVMWYGLVVLAASLLPGRGGAIAGGSWGYALIMPGLASVPFPHALHEVFVALNYINPLAYAGNQGSSHQLIAGGVPEHAIAAWLIGLAAIAIGTQTWARREVPA